ncbi:MAG: tetratricopeptide repeat protein [Planctomycetaceae bacterium]|nr:tetratricopeptide repeat protein [Planctomycetaceae bacterium]
MLVITIVGIVVAWAFGTKPLVRRYKFSRVHRAINDRNWDEALGQLAAFDESYGSTSESLFLRARALRHSGAYDQVDVALNKAEHLGCDENRIERERLFLQVELGQTSPDDRMLQRLAMDPGGDAQEVFEALVKGYFLNDELGRATMVLDAWHKSFPNDPQPFFYGGTIAEHNKQLEDSVRWHRQAVALAPKNPDFRRRLAEVQLSLRNYRQACLHFEVALSLREDVESLWGLGLCLKYQGKLELARESFVRGLKVAPNNTLCLVALGEMGIEAGNGEEALRWLESASKVNLNDYDMQYDTARALLFSGQGDLAKAHFQRAAALRRELTRIEQLQEMAKSSPDDAELRYQIGKSVAQYGDREEAAKWLRGALKCDPNHQLARETLTSLTMTQTQN